MEEILILLWTRPSWCQFKCEKHCIDKFHNYTKSIQLAFTFQKTCLQKRFLMTLVKLLVKFALLDVYLECILLIFSFRKLMIFLFTSFFPSTISISSGCPLEVIVFFSNEKTIVEAFLFSGEISKQICSILPLSSNFIYNLQIFWDQKRLCLIFQVRLKRLPSILLATEFFLGGKE